MKGALIFSSVIGGVPLCADHNDSLNHRWNFLGEFVYMRRTKINNEALVFDPTKPQCPLTSCPNFAGISSKQLVNDMGFEPGYRVGISYMDTPKSSFEGNFLYVSPWSAERTETKTAGLYFPFKDIRTTGDYYKADKAKAAYKNGFWDVELNYWRHLTPRRLDFFSVSGIAGLRYFHWNESLKLTFFKSTDESDYRIKTKNDVFGAQVGGNLQMNPTQWLSWDLTAKVGAMFDSAEQQSVLRDFNNTVLLAKYRKQEWQVGIYTDVAAQVGFQFKDHFNLHAGYQFLFFSGLALAPGQVDKKLDVGAGKKINTNGTAIIHGLFVGLTLSF
jgi:hypothetical protein